MLKTSVPPKEIAGATMAVRTLIVETPTRLFRSQAHVVALLKGQKSRRKSMDNSSGLNYY
jgi:hypothetical protein